MPGARIPLHFTWAALPMPSEGTPRTFIEVAARASDDPQRSTWPAVARTGIPARKNESLGLDFDGRLDHAPSVTLPACATLRW